ncbi:hypothetical protein [Spongiactinospora sp. TRM90649]|uniref:AMIN-like domain-containing (lipo)protein n=1 Tax=Spongiactinospora sp. TRM90649 TaxID=3031114 RepID=UPI0023F924DC|nr:hypothetical protein [Spongiactinospora sp. TRM90649]MDF5751293.1 hypothetical protein [Spongiactinospora sp. TRM90649]
MNTTRTALSLLALMVLTACGSGSGQATTAPGTGSPAPGSATPSADAPTSATSPASPTTSGSPSAVALPPTGTEEVEVERDGMDPALVRKVRFAGHPGFDRVVIDLTGAVPGYSARWASKLVQDGSGDPIPVKGGAYLAVTLRPAHAHDTDGDPVWTGGPIYTAGLTNVTKVVRTGDFEGVVGVGLVLDHRAGFRVFEQKNPSRLVVDVAH